MKRILSLLLLLILVGCASYQPKYCSPALSPLLTPLSDSCETFNRNVQVFNKGVELHVVSPVSCFWRFLFPQCVRDCIGNFTANLQYPLNLVTHALGGEFGYCWKDTERFFVNTTAGALGLFDPATAWGMPAINGGFQHTFSQWGIGEGTYMNLPFMGGASLRHQIGTICNYPLNPLDWFVAQKVALGIKAGKSINDLAKEEPTITQFFKTHNTTYELQKLFQYYSQIAITEEVRFDPNCPDWDVDDSFGYLALAPQDKEALHKTFTREVKSSAFGTIRYTYWHQKAPQRLVILLPGIGSHRLDNSVLTLSEKLRKENCAVVAISSTFTPDYFAGLNTDRPAGYLPEDVKLLAKILNAIVTDYLAMRQLPSDLPCSILGYSLGGLNTLFLADAVARGEATLNFHATRFVAVNPPADSRAALAIIDKYFQTPEKWGTNDAERSAKIRDMMLRFAAFIQAPNYLNPVQGPIPLTREESLFLVAANMRLNLASTVQAQQKLHPTGILNENPAAFAKRNAIMDETFAFSFDDYMQKILLPWYHEHGFADKSAEDLAKDCTLAAILPSLQNNDHIAVFQNANDFLLEEGKADWFREAFGSKITMMDRGGHLGNLASPGFQKLVFEQLLQ